MSDQDQSVDQKSPTRIETPQEVLADAQNSFSKAIDSVFGKGTITSIKKWRWKASEMLSKAWSFTRQQLGTASTYIGWDELAENVKELSKPISTLLLENLEILFFINPQLRISRGQYVLWLLLMLIITWIIGSVMWAILWIGGIWMWIIILFVLFLNISIKRFHDFGKPRGWALSVLIPFFWLIAPILIKGDEWKNEFWEWNETEVDLSTHIIALLFLGISALLVMIVMIVIWVRLRTPSPNVAGTTTRTDSVLWDGSNEPSKPSQSNSRRFQ